MMMSVGRGLYDAMDAVISAGAMFFICRSAISARLRGRPDKVTVDMCAPNMTKRLSIIVPNRAHRRGRAPSGARLRGTNVHVRKRPGSLRAVVGLTIVAFSAC